MLWSLEEGVKADRSLEGRTTAVNMLQSGRPGSIRSVRRDMETLHGRLEVHSRGCHTAFCTQHEPDGREHAVGGCHGEFTPGRRHEVSTYSGDNDHKTDGPRGWTRRRSPFLQHGHVGSVGSE